MGDKVRTHAARSLSLKIRAGEVP